MRIARFTVDGETRDFPFDLAMLSECDECERLTGWKWHEMVSNLLDSRARAIQFAWWIAGKRAGVTEVLSEVDFNIAAAKLELIIEDEDEAEAPAELGVTDDEGPFGQEPEPSPDSEALETI